jgi:hypothetical protein
LREPCVTLCDRFPFVSDNRLKEVMAWAEHWQAMWL